jgi:hypothetical protein
MPAKLYRGGSEFFMLSKDEDNLAELAHKFFVEELGLRPEDVPEAERNLVGLYEVLFRIDQRIHQQTL